MQTIVAFHQQVQSGDFISIGFVLFNLYTNCLFGESDISVNLISVIALIENM